jgi:Flp pilus assembly pilin Flp
MSDLLRRLCIRLYAGPRGQTAAEYVGVLLVVSVIIAAVSQTSIGTTIRTKMDHVVKMVATGDTDAKNAPKDCTGSKC